MSDTSSSTLQHEPACDPSPAQSIGGSYKKFTEELCEMTDSFLRSEQERIHQIHAVETTRLQNIIATKDARIQELEGALLDEKALNRPADTQPSSPPSPTSSSSSSPSTDRGQSRGKALWDSDDEVHRCPQCNWELDEYEDLCERCDWKADNSDDGDDDEEDDDEDN